ncbi:MAG: hypothetical protein GY820_22220 [Gammaproteobacteria bacterium]|nr:hypothetical protein [Gammaproteobacteria bacterium]
MRRISLEIKQLAPVRPVLIGEGRRPHYQEEQSTLLVAKHKMSYNHRHKKDNLEETDYNSILDIKREQEGNPN